MNPPGRAKCAAPAATYVSPMTGHVALDHDMTVGRACSTSGPRLEHQPTVKAPIPAHTASRTAVWAGGSRADTTAPLYPGWVHGGLDTDGGFASTSSPTALVAVTRRNDVTVGLDTSGP